MTFRESGTSFCPGWSGWGSASRSITAPRNVRTIWSTSSVSREQRNKRGIRMKIVETLVEETILPRKDKDWKFALAASPATQGWTVSIRAEDGTVGYGYAATMNHYGAPHAAVQGALDG